MRIARILRLSLLLPIYLSQPVFGVEDYIEPGSLRLSHTVALEGVFQRLRPGWNAIGSGGTNKNFFVQGNDEKPWKSEWGQRVLTEFASRMSPDVFGRALIEWQGEYADRFWRPINANHQAKIDNNDFIIREAEGRIDKDQWYLHGFSAVERPNWSDKGDFFQLYPDVYKTRDYLGTSGFFGVYPNNWQEDQFRNITRRQIPRGAEMGVEWFGMDGTVAYGDELTWGYEDAFFGRWRVPMRGTAFTFVYKDIDSDENIFDEDERDRAYALSWNVPFEAGHLLDLGVLYNPYRTGESYQIVRKGSLGEGILGTDHVISQKTSRKKDAFAARLRFEHFLTFLNHLYIWSVDLTRAEILAGNKEEIDVDLTTNFGEDFKGNILYIYRRPVERAIPFLFEGTPNNLGAVAASPRGPESPFTVDWSNRESIFLFTTLQYDPTPGSQFLMFDPKALALWNVNPDEDSHLSFAVQYKMSDYRDTTDRQSYYDEKGDLIWESAAHTGAWPTDHPLHEVRLLTRGFIRDWNWTFGVAGGQSPALLGLAYSNDKSVEKPITEYFSIEGRLDRWPIGIWWHYGSGIWGPEENIHPFFGLSYDRLWGLGGSYNITKNTTWDIGYLAARQDDDLFVASDLGSYDEIRTVFSHRFGFIFQFKGPSRRGYQT